MSWSHRILGEVTLNQPTACEVYRCGTGVRCTDVVRMWHFPSSPNGHGNSVRLTVSRTQMVITLRWPLHLRLTDSRHLTQGEGVLTGVVGATAGMLLLRSSYCAVGFW